MKNQNELIEKYPEFFEYLKDHKGPIIPIQFGFECGDGWYWLLSSLMALIHRYCKNSNIEIPEITQIKEKYGGLRFYYSGGDEKIYGMVSFAEILSYKICEECGSTENVTQNKGGWIYTRCDKCRTKKKDYSWISYRMKKMVAKIKSLGKQLLN